MSTTSTATKQAPQVESVVKFKNVRIAFPVLFVPKAVNGEGEPAYSASFIITKDQKDNIAAIETAVRKAAISKWKDKADAVIKKLKLANKVPPFDGDMKADYDGYEGNLYVSARAKIKPRVVDRQNIEVSATDGIPYSGSYVNATLTVWAQDNQYGQRINCQLRGVQFAKDGEAFSGGKPAGDDEFEQLDDDSDDLA